MSVTFKYILRPRQKADGTHPIVLKLTVDREHAWLTTGFTVLENHWNEDANDKLENWINRKADDYHIIVTGLRNKYRQAQAALLQLQLTGTPITLAVAKKAINDAWDGTANEVAEEDKKPPLLIDFIKEQADMASAVSPETASKYMTLVNDFTAFSNGSEILISGFDTITLDKYIAYLRKVPNQESTIKKKLEFIRTILKKAERYRLIDPRDNPFIGFTFRAKSKPGTVLSREEMMRLRRIRLKPGTNQFHARNIFMFQYYCWGSRIGDMLKLRWQDIVDGRVVFEAKKNERKRSIKLKERALAILAIYEPNATSPQDYVFPFVKRGTDYDYILTNYKRALGGPTANVNKALRKVVARAGIDKEVSSHDARHTFAWHLYKATRDIYLVSKALGHSSVAITENYLRQLDQGELDEGVDALSEG